MVDGREIQAATDAMIRDMFLPSEMPVADEIRAKYWSMAKRALEAAERVRNGRQPSDGEPSEVTVRRMRDEEWR